MKRGCVKEHRLVQNQRPDWSLWSRSTEVTLWEALLLALDVCPHTYHHRHHDIGSDNQHRYWAHQTIANNEIESKAVDWVTHKPRGLFSAQDTYVNFSLFAKWYLERISLNAPDEFKRLYVDGYNLSKQKGDWIAVARAIALRHIQDVSRAWSLTQDSLAKKVASELELMGIRSIRGGVISWQYVRTEALTADDWYQRFKTSPNI